MDKKFSTSSTPLVIGVVRERTAQNSIKKIREYKESGATAIDWHLSCLEDEYKDISQLKIVEDSTDLPILALNYNQRYDWSEIDDSEEDRIGLLMKALKAGVSAIDIQGYTFDVQSKRKFVGDNIYSFTRNNPFEIVTDKKVIDKQKDLIKRVHDMGKEVLLSTHPYIPMNCKQITDLVCFLAERNPDVIKLVTRCLTEDDLTEAFYTMRQLKKLNLRQKISFHCCDELGKTTRLVNPVLGSYMCFCTKADDESRNKEQLDIQTAVGFFKEFGWLK